jgi:hypothetical protein
MAVRTGSSFPTTIASDAMQVLLFIAVGLVGDGDSARRHAALLCQSTGWLSRAH